MASGKSRASSLTVYAGMFLISCATLMYEILLTRIFSVTMWYHFAFLAVSVAMLGLTAGAILVFIKPDYFNKKTPTKLALFSLLFAITAVLGILLHINYDINSQSGGSAQVWFLLTFLGATIPFVFSGVVISLIVTKYVKDIGRIYAMDLGGAALGCVLVLASLNLVDGPKVTLIIAFLSLIAANIFLFNVPTGLLKKTSIALFLLVLSAFIYFQFLPIGNKNNLFNLRTVKGASESKPIFEKWNSFSRIAVFTVSEEKNKAYFEGTGNIRNYQVPQVLHLNIDGSASTPLVKFEGDFDKLEFLKGDISNFGFHLKDKPKTLIVGAGGGKDVLSALLFGARDVTAVEINKSIIEALNSKFGEFTGHLDKFPGVNFVNDEARSFLSANATKYDLIQISLIDTWAATSAGAYVLSENSLYTVEAWQAFLKSLDTDGILSVTRWYFDDSPYEAYRLTGLANQSLKAYGINKGRDNIILVKITNHTKTLPSGVGMATMLISKEPFNPSDLALLTNTAQKYGFEIVLSPNYAKDAIFEGIFTENYLEISDKTGANLIPPTDDSPFFFNMIRFKDLSNSKLTGNDANANNLAAVWVLMMSFITVTFLCVIFIIVPFVFKRTSFSKNGSLGLFAYFALIGVGFMLLEISLMQRLTIFLGHPTYGLSVLLFILLLSTGFGSYFSGIYFNKLSKFKLRNFALIFLVIILVVGLISREFINLFSGFSTAIRILVTLVSIAPLGILMGMMFPVGMKLIALKKLNETVPWFWAVNGAASVYASVFAIVLTLSYGISTTYWLGFGSYLLATSVVIFVFNKIKLQAS